MWIDSRSDPVSWVEAQISMCDTSCVETEHDCGLFVPPSTPPVDVLVLVSGAVDSGRDALLNSFVYIIVL